MLDKFNTKMTSLLVGKVLVQTHFTRGTKFHAIVDDVSTIGRHLVSTWVQVN